MKMHVEFWADISTVSSVVFTYFTQLPAGREVIKFVVFLCIYFQAILCRCPDVLCVFTRKFLSICDKINKFEIY